MPPVIVAMRSLERDHGETVAARLLICRSGRRLFKIVRAKRVGPGCIRFKLVDPNTEANRGSKIIKCETTFLPAWFTESTRRAS